MAIAAALIAYLIGSISFAVIVSRALGLPDPRSYGSKNPGATNVLRTGKKLAAAATLLGDGAKGWLAVFLTEIIFRSEVVPSYKMSLVAINVWLAACTAATWIVIAFFFRISSLAAMIAAVSAPGFCYLLYGVHPF